MFSASTKLGRNSGATVDAQFNYVTMLLHGDGTNGAQNNTFLDSSANTFSITRNGNTTQGSFSPYGSNWSNYFGGTGDYLTVPDSNQTDLGSGDFTVEFWFYQFSAKVASCISLNGALAANGYAFGASTTVNRIWWYATSAQIVSSTNFNYNTWNHVAVVRNSGTTTMYQNGVNVGSFTDSKNYSGGITYIGSDETASQDWNGYLSNVRIVKGTAVYTSAFTPSTIPLTAITNTQLLTCQSNRFIDNSTNAFAITVNGTPSVQRFNPFGTSTAYSTSVIGGSGYFDGSDNLTIPANANFTLSTSNYTMEFWVYPNSFSAPNVPLAYGWSDAGSPRLIVFAQNTNGTFIVYYNDAGTNFTSSNTVTLNQWNHVALVRNGSTFTLYINGVSGASASNSISYPALVNPVIIGSSWNGSVGTNFYNGYISDVRICIGTAVYTSNFTPPTAPLTAVTNTQLLTSMTNGAIFDNAMINDLETVGNAQISTSVKKYGTGSLAFDGTGDYLYVPNFVTNQLRTADYTIEYWIYANSWSTTPVILEYGRGVGPTGFGLEFYISTTGGQLDVYGGASSGTLLASYSSLSTGAWIHVALTRASGTTRLFINGTQSGSSVTDNTDYTSAIVTLGAYYNGTLGLNGYIDDFRITKGYARYTANFTPPTAAFQNIGPY